MAIDLELPPMATAPPSATPRAKARMLSGDKAEGSRGVTHSFGKNLTQADESKQLQSSRLSVRSQTDGFRVKAGVQPLISVSMYFHNELGRTLTGFLPPTRSLRWRSEN